MVFVPFAAHFPLNRNHYANLQNNDVLIIYFQIEYASEPSQLDFLRLLSDRARQRIKYNCKDSVAWGDENNEFSKSIKIKADNGVEMHAESSNKFKPKLILDGCSVRNCCYTNSNHRLFSVFVNYTEAW